MCSNSTFYILGLSGGPDSVALLHWMCREHDKEHLLVTHCNFHLRGEESMRDQFFCQQLCRQMEVRLIVKDFDTRAYMEEHHVSLELAARELRYAWWEQLALEQEAASGMPVQIAVGHHRDDSIETLLMNLMRGTGIKGLVGIPATNGRIIRPLLHLSRTEILTYLEEHHLSYITDSSNLENEATRNKVRNRLLPLMEQINPHVREGIAKTIHLLQETQRLESLQLDQIFSTTQHLRAAGVEWDEWLVPESVTSSSEADSLFHHWQERHPLAMRHGRLFYTAIPDLSGQTYDLHAEELTLPTPSFSPDRELFDLDTLSLPLTCRHWHEGDRLQPLGMKGTKLVSDLFSNAHFSPNRKATTWIVTDASDRILWVVGLRVADWSKITTGTQRILAVEMPK